jgi:hypothetical protein
MLIGIMWLSPKSNPFQNSIVLKVMMKDGSPVLTTISPLINPKEAPTGSTRTNAKRGSIPFMISSVKIYEQNGIIEAIERSNSPAIIRMPIPNATTPISGVSFAMEARFLGSRNMLSGVKMEKIRKVIIKVIAVFKP